VHKEVKDFRVHKDLKVLVDHKELLEDKVLKG
jgi:hypothetical protein